MRKYKCGKCDCCFSEDDADTVNVEIDYDPRWGSYCESYYACPECREHEDLEELDLDKECQAYDEEHGCDGCCDKCPVHQEGEQEEEDGE